MASCTAVDDPLLTTFGRFIEVQAGLGQHLSRRLENICGIPSTWFEVLLRIARADDNLVSMSGLAKQVALTTGGITRLLDRMTTAGLVERVPCSTDRRVSYAGLTAVGRAKLEEAAAVHSADLRTAFAAFSRDELTALDGLLDRLRDVRLDVVD